MRSPKPPRCGVCDGPDPVLHCQQCDEPTCARHVHRLFVMEGIPASYLCALCAEEHGADLTAYPSVDATAEAWLATHQGQAVAS